MKPCDAALSLFPRASHSPVVSTCFRAATAPPLDGVLHTTTRFYRSSQGYACSTIPTTGQQRRVYLPLVYDTSLGRRRFKGKRVTSSCARTDRSSYRRRKFQSRRRLCVCMLESYRVRQLCAVWFVRDEETLDSLGSQRRRRRRGGRKKPEIAIIIKFTCLVRRRAENSIEERRDSKWM